MATVTHLVVEVPAHLPEEARNNLFFHIGQVADGWAEQFEDRDWDPFVFTVTAEGEV